MLVLNKKRAIEKKKFDKDLPVKKSSSVKKLSASNVNFLQSLGFVVRK